MILKGGCWFPLSSLMCSPNLSLGILKGFTSYPLEHLPYWWPGVDPTHHLQVSLISDLHLSTTLRSKILSILHCGIVVHDHRGRDGCWRFCLDFWNDGKWGTQRIKHQSPSPTTIYDNKLRSSIFINEHVCDCVFGKAFSFQMIREWWRLALR